MAGTCKYCGAPTWGRYRICPDCRKERKKNREYSNYRNYSKTNDDGENLIFVIFLIFLGYLIYNFKIKGVFLFLFGSIIFVLMGFYFYFKVKKSNRKKYFCDNCDYLWKSKKTFGMPARCPRCNSKSVIPYLETEIGKRKMKKAKIAHIILTIILIFLTSIFTIFQSGISNGTNINSPNLSQETISPEEELINFCISQFSNAGIFGLKKTDYQSNFSSASDWIKNNYENSALTEEQKEHNINYIIENQLPKENYPIIITYASKKIDSQMIEHGFYYCNENGVI